MTEIVVEELVSTISQTFRFDQGIVIGGVRSYLYIHNVPSGTFTVAIKDAAHSVFTDSFSATDMQTDLGTANNYFHMWYNHDLVEPIGLAAGTYTIELSSSGYSFAEANYIGWVKPHEDKRILEDYTSTLYKNPIGFEIWSY